MKSLRSAGLVLSLLFGAISVAGCAVTGDDAATSEDAVTAGLHEPQGAERKAILDAFRGQLSADLQGQAVIFNSTDPAGRFVANGDWASYEGILEGPNGNTQPIDYSRSIYRDAAEGGYLGGVDRNGHFAAKFLGMAHRTANGTWEIAKANVYGRETPAYAVGANYDQWTEWAATPPPAFRNVSRTFPVDDLHEPQGDERKAILSAIRSVLSPDLHGQAFLLNHTDPQGTFLVHDKWAFFSGIIEGPNGNTTAVNYLDSVYEDKLGGTGFHGLLRNGNFAASLRVLLEQNADGSWKVSAQQNDGEEATSGYAVGVLRSSLGYPRSPYAYDIFPAGSGDGEGEGDGDGDGDGDGAPANGDGG